MTAIAVIPARLASTRLPRKALRDLAGLPMVGHVYRGVCACPLLDGVIIATDSEQIMEVCNKHGWHARMTSAQHRSGTERVQEIANSAAADVYLNVQGDEPLTRPEHIASLLEVMAEPGVEVGTLKTPAPSRTSRIQMPSRWSRMRRGAPYIFPGPRSRMIATELVLPTSSIWDFMPTAKLRSIGLYRCRSPRWKKRTPGTVKIS